MRASALTHWGRYDTRPRVSALSLGPVGAREPLPLLLAGGRDRGLRQHVAYRLGLLQVGGEVFAGFGVNVVQAIPPAYWPTPRASSHAATCTADLHVM